jgi:hypothetical protein
MNPELLLRLTRSLVVTFILAGLVTVLPGAREIQVAEAAGTPPPLLRFNEPAPAPQTQGGFCTNPGRIVQDCAFGSLSGIRALEQQVISDLIAIHQLPERVPTSSAAAASPLQGRQDTASRLLSWERDTLRTLLFDKIAMIINRAPAPVGCTSEEQAIVDALATLVGQKRLAAARFARSEYARWARNPCLYEAPPGFRYEIPSSCAGPLGDLFGAPTPPSLEQFEAFGAAAAYQQYAADVDLQAAAAQAVKRYELLSGLGAAGIAAAATYSFIASTALGQALALAIAPFAGVVGSSSAGVISSAAAAGAATAGAFAAAAVVVVIAVAAAVVGGIELFRAESLPRQLDEAITAAQNPPDLQTLIGSQAGKQEIFAAYLQTTVPTANAPAVLGGLTGWTPVPAARPDATTRSSSSTQVRRSGRARNWSSGAGIARAAPVSARAGSSTKTLPAGRR